MPSRPSLHIGTSTSPRQSANAVDQVVSAISRKLTTAASATNSSARPASRRSSLSMDAVFHKKEKKSDDQKLREDGRPDKKLSLSMRGTSKSKDRVSTPSPRIAPLQPARLELLVDSPPLVMHGTTVHSTGALFGGRVKLHVEDPTGKVTIKKLTWALRGTIATRKPVGKDCRDCVDKHEIIETENVVMEPKVFTKGEDNQFPQQQIIEKIEIVHPLTVQRAIPEAPNKASIRIFPPTNLTGRVVLPPVVHPIGTFPVQMTLSGVVEKKGESFLRWRLRKLLWRVEEHSKIVSVPCTKHQAKVNQGKAIQHTETRVLGQDETKTGWKTDFDTIGGEIYLEFDASLATKSSHKPCCDVSSPTGLEVKHNLVIELIIAEEYVPVKNPHLITPTGAARVLRMQFALQVTERGGMGISWDEEMPPMYEDVPPSPPGYGSADKNDGAFGGAVMEDYHGPELEYTELERMQSSNPNDPPVYIERDMMRPRAHLHDDIASPSSRRLGGFTADELVTEPPQYALRRRASSHDSSAPMEEDFGQGEAGTAT